MSPYVILCFVCVCFFLSSVDQTACEFHSDMDLKQQVSVLTSEWLKHVNDWRFEPNVTPFSEWYWPIAACIAYFVIIWTLQRIMSTRKPLVIPFFLFCHNMSLCLSSLILAVWITYTLGAELYGGLTPYQLVCSRQIYDNGHMQFIYYVNAFFKIWEFLDTFLLALRKKPIAFLHAYHHGATLLLTWSQMMEHSAPQWVPIILNLWVHVIMYYYYAMSALGIRVWWKKYLTTFQISQFLIDVTVVGYAFYSFILSGFDQDVCYGTVRGAVVGLSILFSYLLLFIRFYFQTYTKGASQSARSKTKRQ